MLTRSLIKRKVVTIAARGKAWTADELPGPRTPLQPLPQIPMACEPIEKEDALQHEGYMNLVRAMKCAHCGKAPRSQFCHADQGKGMGIKTDCRRGWPGCARCHELVGSSGFFKREHRRLLEDEYAERTRAAIVEAGTWPARLPLWSEERELA